MNALDISRYAYTAFFRLWREHPLDMARVTLSQLREKQAMLAFMPLEAAVQLRLWARWDTSWKQQNALMKAGRHLSRAFSILILAAFLIGVPVVAWKRGVSRVDAPEADHRSTWLMILLTLMYLGYTFAYASVSLETRYLMPIEPFSAVIGLILIDGILQKYGRSFWMNARQGFRRDR